ncbi:hypothetical protein MKX01_022248 [Papaver californicum]|nr:hypothetical protein MKX01_022248 [Papaver californicum]
MGEHRVTGELEKILSNTEQKGFDSFFSATYIKLKLLFFLAAPTVMVYMINMLCPCPPKSFPVISVILNWLLHHWGILLGMGNAVETLCGQAYRAGKYEMLGVYL